MSMTILLASIAVSVIGGFLALFLGCLLYTSDAADD